MESRGHSKRTLVALKGEIVDPLSPPEKRPQPVTGSLVWRSESPEGDPVGVVTSSTLSPMLGATPVCFAAIKHGVEAPGTDLLIAADQTKIHAIVQPTLVFWKR
jgi:glycine cleavage system aminomethyltransferase T